MPYTPKPPPRTRPEFQELYDYIEQELQGISRELLGTSELELRTTAREPARPREGMIVQADGTTWDPGEGAGTYKYEAGVWKRFGDANHVHTLVDITDAGALAALDEVALSDIADIDTQRVVGRNTAGTGVPEQVSLTQVLDWIGSAARGDILVRGASTWSRLAKGAADTYLKSDGTDPAWATLPPAGWTELQSNTLSSGSTTDFTNISQDHKILLFIGTEIDHSTTSGGLFMRFGTTSGFGTLYDVYTGNVNSTGNSLGGSGLSSSTELYIANNATDSTSFFFVLVFDYPGTSDFKLVFGVQGRVQSNRVIVFSLGVVRTAAALQHIRFAASAGNFVGGKIRMVGLL
jgi:hypothetical protein